MKTQQSTTICKTSDVQKTEQASVVNGARTCRRMNVKMVQNVLLIWVDNNIDEENSADCRNTVVQLRRVVNTINTFTDGNECIEFLETNNNEKVCIIISGSLGQHIVPRIHRLSQVDSIFIFCANKNYHEEWAKDWSKIKGVFTEIIPICVALKEAAQECEQNLTPISIMATNDNAINKKLDQLDPTFMYTQIFKEIILSIKFEQQHITELIDYCQVVFTDNEAELVNVKNLKQNYRNETPVWWYTYECFLYPMLNRGIRTMDGDIMIKMGFFINDLHRHIEQLHQEQFIHHHTSSTFTVYRGQGLSKQDFDHLMKTKGGLISFNNFLSTSKNREVSLRFARKALTNPDLVGIFFVMTINTSISSMPFASITEISYFKEEDEVLFSMHTVFRISDIKSLNNNNRLFQVDLTLTSDDDKDLRVLTDSIKEEIKGSIGWYRLGELLLKICQPKKAEEVYKVLLEQTSDESGKGYIYDRLGLAKYTQGKYQEAIASYEKSLEIDKKMPSSKHLNLASTYNNLGMVYYNMSDYTKALSYYEKDLEISQKSLPSNHPNLALTYNNIGVVYCNMGNNSKALSSYEKALEIEQQSLPSNHPDLAKSYNNIGSVYYNIGEYSKALSSHEKALEIRQQSLPSDHTDLGASYNNIGNVYKNMGEYSKALSYYEKTLEIGKKALPSNHPNLALIYNNIGNVYDGMHEYSKALSSHEKALEIRQQSLSSNHPDLAMSYNNIGWVYYNKGEYSEARSYYERAVSIGQHSLPSNHSELQKWRNNLDLVKKKF